ncbi:MAG: SIMPL domain-containing protein [Nannocystis sp.]|nr:SIMPL domain-containing protein [Nannocystis sp.]MBA3550533.1 SIMPL domain-containing protein [Nannocystis sp.]
MLGTKGTITVTGTAQIRARADQATIDLAVVTRADSASDAIRENAKIADQVIAAVKQQGVSQDAIATAGIRVGPFYTWDKETETNKLGGYEAINAVVVDIRVEMAGAVYDAGIAAGATHGGGLTFRLRDEAGHRKQALLAAVKSARDEAEVVTRAMKVRIQGPERIEVPQVSEPVLFKSARMAMADNAPETPVLPGEITVRATVEVTFRFR